MKQNIYDNPEFFKGYKNLRETQSGLNEVLEIPALKSLLPDLSGKRVLDLGCGFGWFCKYAVEKGAEHVIGVDISEKMLEEARKNNNHEKIEYVRSPIEDYKTDPGSVDLVVSSLVFQYLKDYKGVVENIYSMLSKNGEFIFSNEHPMCTALGGGCWQKDDNGNKLHWKVDNYKDEGERNTTWFIEDRIIYHRTTETLVNTLIDCGFIITHLSEPEAPDEFAKERPDLEEQRRRPPFIIISSVKPV